MPFQYSYLPVEAYRSPYAQAIAGATGGADRARAGAAEQTGQIAANAASSIGQIASGTLHDFLSYKLEQPRRDLIAAQAGVERAKLSDIQRAEADDKAVREALQATGGDHDAALQVLDTRNPTAAQKLRSALTEGRIKGLDEQDKTLKVVNDKLKTASQLLQGVPTADDPWTAYANILPKVREVVGPDLSKHLPDDYDPDTVGQAITWGETAQQTLERRRAALETAREGVATNKDARERDAYFTKALGQWLPTVSTQDEWDKALGSVKALGASPETLARFGAQYSPEAVQRAATFGLTPEEQARANKPPTAGSVADFFATYARDVVHKPLDALTVQDKEVAAHRWAMAHKVDSPTELTAGKRTELVQTILKYPSVYHDLTDTTKSAIAGELNAAGFTGFARQATPATLAAAERWRQEQLVALETRFKAAQALPETHGVMTAEDLQAAKDAINVSYRAQIGGSAAAPVAAPPAAPAARSAAAPKPKTVTVPAPVATALKGQKPGKYTLSDHSVWIVGKDGTVQPGQ